MGHGIRPLTRLPERAQNIAPEVKLSFVRDFLAVTGDEPVLVSVLTATIPLFVNKDPSNPASG